MSAGETLLSEQAVLPDAITSAYYFGLFSTSVSMELIHRYVEGDKVFEVKLIKKAFGLVQAYVLFENGVSIGSVLSVKFSPGVVHVIGIKLIESYRGYKFNKPSCEIEGGVISRADGKSLGLAYYLFGVFTQIEADSGNNVILEVANYNKAALSLYENISVKRKVNVDIQYVSLDEAGISKYAILRRKKIDRIYNDNDICCVKWTHIPLYNNVLTWSLNRVYAISDLDEITLKSMFFKFLYGSKLLIGGLVFGQPIVALKLYARSVLRKN